LGGVFGPQPRAGWVWLMAIITGAYLMIECGFNSRLLDVVGGMPDHQTVEAIETYGRAISGFAVALMFWPGLLKKGIAQGRHWLHTGLRLAFVSGIVIAVVYRGELKLVDWVVDRSGPEQRYVATNLVAVQNALVARGAELDGLPLTPAQMTEPDGKTFLAIFPLLAFSTNDLDEKIRNHKPAILRVVADRLYGGAAENYNRFIASRAEMIRRYNDDYLKASDDYNRSLGRIGAEQHRAWADYERKLEKKRLSPERVPPLYWGRIGKDVRASGVPVPANWDPSDQTAFNNAIATRIRGETDRRFREGMQRQFPQGTSVPPNLDKNAFFSHPTIQARWREELKYGNSGVVLPVNLPDRATAPAYFQRQVYDKVLSWQVQDRLKKYDAPVATFADGAPQAPLGREQMRALAVPPIALAFSIIGALVHIIKLVLFVLQLSVGRGFMHGAVKAVCVPALAVGLLASFHFIPTSTITAQPLYQYFDDRGATLGDGHQQTWYGRSAMFFVRSVIHAQVVAYPCFEAVRHHILAGYEFGYHTNTVSTNGHSS
jgi:hypothetical protein